MKTLGLLRHAKSDWDDMRQRDFDRGVSARGLAGARLIGAHIRDQGIAWDRLLASPAARVKATLQETALGVAPTWIDKLYLADTTTLTDTLTANASDADSALIVGHNPGLQEMLFFLVPPEQENARFDEAAQKFPTASFAVLELDITQWADLTKGCGRLVHFTRPRDLDPALGPISTF